MGRTPHALKIVASLLLGYALVLSALAVTADSSAPSLTASVYKKLLQSQQALKEQQLAESLSILQTVVGNQSNTAYDNAMIWQMTGYIEYQRGNLQASAAAFEKVFSYEIPLSLSTNTHKILGQVYMALQQYEDALPHLKSWVQNNDEDKATGYAMLAQCYYPLKQYQQAVQFLNLAIADYRKQGKTPKEQWLNLLQASQAQLQDIKHRVETIKLLLAWFPKKEYWLALASAYAQLERMDNYLAILALAERKELLNSEAQYLSLASVYLAQGAPMNAATIVEEGMGKQRITRNLRNLRLLATAYTLAREYDAALTPLRQAAILDTEGETDLLLGNALYQLARWEEAAKALEKALEKGNLSQTTNAWMLLGQTYLNIKQYDQSLHAFEQAAQDQSKAKQVLQWLKYVRYEQQRAHANSTLKEAGANETSAQEENPT